MRLNTLVSYLSFNVGTTNSTTVFIIKYRKTKIYCDTCPQILENSFFRLYVYQYEKFPIIFWTSITFYLQGAHYSKPIQSKVNSRLHDESFFIQVFIAAEHKIYYMVMQYMNHICYTTI